MWPSNSTSSATPSWAARSKTLDSSGAIPRPPQSGRDAAPAKGSNRLNSLHRPLPRNEHSPIAAIRRGLCPRLSGVAGRDPSGARRTLFPMIRVGSFRLASITLASSLPTATTESGFFRPERNTARPSRARGLEGVTTSADQCSVCTQGTLIARALASLAGNKAGKAIVCSRSVSLSRARNFPSRWSESSRTRAVVHDSSDAYAKLRLPLTRFPT